MTRRYSTEPFLRAHMGCEGDDCVIWPFCTDESGYGFANVGGRRGRAHRLMCILVHGEPPSQEHEAAHSCCNPTCVNPRHLRWATSAENLADREIHGTTNFVGGERHGMARLSSEQVKAIRADRRQQKFVAADFGISIQHVSKIRSGKAWGCTWTK